MRNKSIWVMGVVLIVLMIFAAVIVVVVANSQKTAAPSSSRNTNTSSTAYSPPKACDILSLAVAQKVAPGVVATDAQTSDVSSDSITVSSCNYYDMTNKVSVGLLVRGAKDNAGAQSNKTQFDTLPSGAQSVSGYGDMAYWEPTLGQFNILKNHNWYILNSGPAVPASRTLEAAKKFADAIIKTL